MLPTIDESSGLWTRTMKNKNNKNKRSINNHTDNDNDNDNGIDKEKASSSSKRQRLVLSDNTNTSTNTNTNTNPFVDTSNKTVVAVSSAVVTTTNNTQSLLLPPTSDEIMKELCKIVAFDDSSDHKRSSSSSASSSSRRKIALKSLLTIRKWIKKSNNNNNNNMNSNSKTSSSQDNFVINELFELGGIPTLLTFLEKNIQNNDIECISVVVSVIVKLTMTMNNNTQQILSLFVKRNGINLLLLANEKICSSDIGTGTGIGIIAAADGGGGDGDGADDYGTTATKLVALKRIWNAIQNNKLSTEILLYKQDDPSILTRIVTAGLDTLETVSTITVPSVAEERDDAITDIATTDPLVSVTTPSLSSSTTSIIASGRASTGSTGGTTRSGMSKLIHKAAASSSSLLKVAITNNLNLKKQHKGSSISKQEQEQDDLKSIASSTSTSLLSTTSSSSSSVSTSTSAKTTSLYPLIPKIMEHIFKTLRHTVMMEGFDVAFTEEMKYDLLSKSLISLTTNDGDGIGSGWNRNNNVLFAALKFYEYCFIGSNSNNKKQPINIPLLFNTQYHYEAIIPFVLQTITRNSVLANKYGAFEIIEKSIPYLDTNFIQKSSISSRMSQVWEQDDNDNDNNNNNKHTETDQQQHKHTTTKSYKVGATQKRAQDILKMLHK